MCNCKPCSCQTQPSACATVPALKLKVQKTYVTRDGRKVLIVADNYATETVDKRPYLGIFPGKFGIAQYTASGKYSADGKEFSLDIVAEYKEPEYRWFNVYPMWRTGYSNGMYKSKSMADAGCNTGAGPSKDRIACCRLDLNTGEVTQEKL